MGTVHALPRRVRNPRLCYVLPEGEGEPVLVRCRVQPKIGTRVKLAIEKGGLFVREVSPRERW